MCMYVVSKFVKNIDLVIVMLCSVSVCVVWEEMLPVSVCVGM